MAWHSGKPADSDFLSASVQYIRENFAELEPLQPYVAALLDSRIVEMGSNSNGEYVRFENGWQVCWFANDPTPNFAARTEGAVSGYVHLDDWTYPAAFSARPSVVAIGRGYVGSRAEISLNTSIINLSTSKAEIRLWAWNQVNANVTILQIAIGRWK